MAKSNERIEEDPGLLQQLNEIWNAAAQNLTTTQDIERTSPAQAKMYRELKNQGGISEKHYERFIKFCEKYDIDHAKQEARQGIIKSLIVKGLSYILGTVKTDL